MKKVNLAKLFKLSFIAIVLFVTASCNSDVEDNSGQRFSTGQSALLNDLATFNRRVLEETPNTRVSARATHVIIEDIYGAYRGGKKGYDIGKEKFHDKRITTVCTLLGGAIYGGYRSFRAYYYENSGLVVKGDKVNADLGYGDKLTKINMDEAETMLYAALSQDLNVVDFGNIAVKDSTARKQINLDAKLLNSVNLSQEQLNIGKLHNVVLASFEGNITTRHAYKIESKDYAVNAAMESKEMEELSDMIGTTGETTYFSTADPLPDKVMELFKEIFQDTANDYSTVVMLINKYAEAIDNSDELTDSQKMHIKNGLATALYSFNYWHNKR